MDVILLSLLGFFFFLVIPYMIITFIKWVIHFSISTYFEEKSKHEKG